MEQDIALPVPEYSEFSKPYWLSGEDGRLRIVKCGACGVLIHYPRPFCPTCYSDAIRWHPVSGDGTVYSVTTIHDGMRLSFPSYADRGAYQVGIVELVEGPRLLTNILSDSGPAQIGDKVEVEFEERAGVWMPQFRRLGGESA